MKIFVIKAKSIRLAATILVVCLTLLAVLIYSMMSGTISVFNADKELPIYCVDVQEKKAAITFDCAWGAEDIPNILATLERENVKATFFIVGQWAEKYPEAALQL